MRATLRPGVLRGQVHRAGRLHLSARLVPAGWRVHAVLRIALSEGRVLLLAERVRLQVRLRQDERRVPAYLSRRLHQRGLHSAEGLQLQAWLFVADHRGPCIGD